MYFKFLILFLFIKLSMISIVFPQSFPVRPESVQNKIDKTFNELVGKKSDWFYQGNAESKYSSLNDRHIDLAILNSMEKGERDVYFLDIGAGHFGWVNYVKRYIVENHYDKNIKVHIIGLTGNYDPSTTRELLDLGRNGPKIYTYKVNGFKIENMSEELEKIGLDLKNKVDLIVSEWTFQHLVDPFGTLAQAYNLLRPSDGIADIDGFQFYLKGNDSPMDLNHVLVIKDILKHSNAKWILPLVSRGGNNKGRLALKRPDDRSLFSNPYLEISAEMDYPQKYRDSFADGKPKIYVRPSEPHSQFENISLFVPRGEERAWIGDREFYQEFNGMRAIKSNRVFFDNQFLEEEFFRKDSVLVLEQNINSIISKESEKVLAISEQRDCHKDPELGPELESIKILVKDIYGYSSDRSSLMENMLKQMSKGKPEPIENKIMCSFSYKDNKKSFQLEHNQILGRPHGRDKKVENIKKVSLDLFKDDPRYHQISRIHKLVQFNPDNSISLIDLSKRAKPAITIRGDVPKFEIKLAKGIFITCQR